MYINYNNTLMRYIVTLLVVLITASLCYGEVLFDEDLFNEEPLRAPIFRISNEWSMYPESTDITNVCVTLDYKMFSQGYYEIPEAPCGVYVFMHFELVNGEFWDGYWAYAIIDSSAPESNTIQLTMMDQDMEWFLHLDGVWRLLFDVTPHIEEYFHPCVKDPRFDRFTVSFVIEGTTTTANENMSWGAVKALYGE